MSFGELLQVLQQGGMVGLLLIIIVGGARGWWVFGWTYKDRIRDLAAERDQWMRAALKGTYTVEKATEVTDTSSKVLEQAIKILQESQPKGG